MARQEVNWKKVARDKLSGKSTIPGIPPTYVVVEHAEQNLEGMADIIGTTINFRRIDKLDSRIADAMRDLTPRERPRTYRVDFRPEKGTPYRTDGNRILAMTSEELDKYRSERMPPSYDQVMKR